MRGVWHVARMHAYYLFLYMKKRSHLREYSRGWEDNIKMELVRLWKLRSVGFIQVANLSGQMNDYSSLKKIL